MKRFSSTTRVNSRRTSPKKRLRRVALVGLGLVVLLVVLPRMLGTMASFSLTPIVSLESWLANSGPLLPQAILEPAELMRENQRLEQELANAVGSDDSLGRLQAENRQLRRLLGDDDASRIAGTVIGRPTATPYDVIIVDKGQRDGVEQHAPVYIGSDQAIGYVEAVYPQSAVITLLSTPDFESSVYILGPNIYTTAVGRGGGVLQVSVPQGIPLAIGDLVVVPTLGAGVYGSIDVVESVPTEPEQRGYVTLSVPLQSLRFVSIGEGPITPLSFAEAAVVVEAAKRDFTTVPVPSGILVDVEEDAATTTATTTRSTIDPTATTTADETIENE